MEDPDHQVNAGRHHGSRVDQGRNWGRALHRVGKPGKKGELSGLSDDTAEDTQCRGRLCRSGFPRDQYWRKAECFMSTPDDHQTDKKTSVSDSVNDKSF